MIADAKRRGLTNQQATDEFNEKGMPPTGSGGGRQLRCGNAASTWRGGPCVRGRSRVARRRLDCPYIFHRDGRPLGDFRKPWKTACKAAGLDGRIVHDLRRSGVRHLINTGNDPHVVMAFSGHRTRRCSAATISSTSTTCGGRLSGAAPTGANPPRCCRWPRRTRRELGAPAAVAELCERQLQGIVSGAGGARTPDL